MSDIYGLIAGGAGVTRQQAKDVVLQAQYAGVVFPGTDRLADTTVRLLAAKIGHVGLDNIVGDDISKCVNLALAVQRRCEEQCRRHPSEHGAD